MLNGFSTWQADTVNTTLSDCSKDCEVFEIGNNLKLFEI